MKVFVVGLDGATFDLIQPWAQEGKLPTLHRLMAEGAWGPLESTTPPMTSPAWPSFATGKYPAKHGVFDFVSAQDSTFSVVNATSVDAQALWGILSAHGKQVGVINVPVTYPPHPVNGFMITGLLSPSTAEIAYPSDLLDRYTDMPRYRVMPSVQYRPGNEQVFIRDLESLVDTRLRFASQLMRDQPWDFMMVHFLATDLAQHALWRYMDPTHPQHESDSPFRYAIQRIYQRVDLAIGELLSDLDDDTTVMIMSDHGFGPLHGIVNLNMLLLEKGLLRLRRDPLTQLRAFLFRHGLTPATVYGWLARLNLQNLVSRVSKSTRNAVFNKFLSFDDIDWSRSVAYALGHIGQIYFDAKGHARHHLDHRAQAEIYEQVVSALRTLVTPDGRPMLDRVIPKEEATFGGHAEEGPDLHLVLDGYRYISCPLFATDGNVISKQIRGDSGSHRMHGILIAHGPHIRAGRVEGARIVDLAPTVLQWMGLPIPDDMDGRALNQIVDDVSTYPLQVQAASLGARRKTHVLSKNEEAEIEARLKGLGYLG